MSEEIISTPDCLTALRAYHVSFIELWFVFLQEPKYCTHGTIIVPQKVQLGTFTIPQCGRVIMMVPGHGHVTDFILQNVRKVDVDFHWLILEIWMYLCPV